MHVNIEEIKLKLYEKIKPSGWGDKLKTFILSEDFEKIIDSLEKDVLDNKLFVPKIKYLFNAFEQCPFEKLKVVIIGQD